jgi:hypothetical protein
MAIAREQLCGHVVFPAVREHTIMEDIFNAIHAGAIHCIIRTSSSVESYSCEK